MAEVVFNLVEGGMRLSCQKCHFLPLFLSSLRFDKEKSSLIFLFVIQITSLLMHVWSPATCSLLSGSESCYFRLPISPTFHPVTVVT